MTTFVPVAGTAPGTPLRPAGRGYVRTGSVHAVAAAQVPTGDPVRTVCGRDLVALTTWRHEDWSRMRDAARPPFTGVCRRCAARAVPA